MLKYNGDVLFSANDVLDWYSCQHKATLSISYFNGVDIPKAEPDGAGELIIEKGLEFEANYLASLKKAGKTVCEISSDGDLEQRMAATEAAIEDGYDVIYQAVLYNNPWLGIADFLVREGDQYIIGDTKLSSSPKIEHVLQAGFYWSIAQNLFPGKIADKISIITRDSSVHDYHFSEFNQIIEEIKNNYFLFMQEQPETDSVKSAACAKCDFSSYCKNIWMERDDLNQISAIRRDQINKIRKAGYTTLKQFAEKPENESIDSLSDRITEKLHWQARLQHDAKVTGEHKYEVIQEITPGRGFAALPEPHPEDRFFDMEGDPLIDGGLEYLFGVYHGESKDVKTGFDFWWAHTITEEKAAFQAFIDYIMKLRNEHPGMHVYHYNAYEIVAMKALSQKYNTRIDEVDRILQEEIFVDLYLHVVKHAIVCSTEGYSIKNLEIYYMEKRDGDVTNAADSIVQYEEWLKTGDQSILDSIFDYNFDDCLSTKLLRDWLVDIRVRHFPDLPWRSIRTRTERQEETANERAEQERILLDQIGIDEAPAASDTSEAALWYGLATFFDRERKPEFQDIYSYFNQDIPELIMNPATLGGLKYIGVVGETGRSKILKYTWPPQEVKFSANDSVMIHNAPWKEISIVDLDIQSRTIKLKMSGKMIQEIGPKISGLLPGSPLRTNAQEAAILDFISDLKEGNIENREALLDIIEGNDPRFVTGKSITNYRNDFPDQHELLKALSRDLDNSVLVVQGPPGTGKTWNISRVILDLVQNGKKIAISSNSHKAINNVVNGIANAANEHENQVSVLKKGTKNREDTLIEEVYGPYATIKNTVEKPNEGEIAFYDVVAGTSWCMADEGMKHKFDYLVVDEAGQVSIAMLIAMANCARNIILVGDQMQLAQPIRARHAGHADLSGLEYYLDGDQVVSDERGIFLDVTRRMHPDVNQWVSDMIYQSALESHESTKDCILLPLHDPHIALKSSGISWMPISHQDNVQSSPEEADEVKKIFDNLLLQEIQESDGTKRSIDINDILIIAPYNAQLNELKSRLPEDARIGTVDKFQGQEAPVVIMSMTSSDQETAPRGIDFLFSRNRLNVAVSRAKCQTIILSSDTLFNAMPNNLNDMQVINTACSLKEYNIYN